MKAATASLFIILLLCNISVARAAQPHEVVQNIVKFDYEAYRNNPFQWIFPEYDYAATVTRIEHKPQAPEGFARIQFYGLSACVPEKYTYDVKRINDIIRFGSESGERIVINKSPDASYLCSEQAIISQKDYCSAYKTARELFFKLYTLTPQSALTVGDKWIVHAKGMVFQNTKKIEIYKADQFIAYVMFTKDAFVKELKFTHSITLFHSAGPLDSHLTITFIADDDELLNQLLATLK